jgi:type I restriction enzyme S subunit
MMPIEFHRDGPWELPEGWVWARLGDVCRFIGRGRGPKYVEVDGIPVINQKCIRWHQLENQYLKFTERGAYENLAEHLKLRPGDILWNSTGAGTIGRALVYDGSLPETTVDSHVTIVRTNEIDPHFICYFIETMRIQQQVVDENVGSTNQLELPRSFVQNVEIPVPPLAEQLRIVARIDELFTEIADGEAALARAREDLDTWRRALLKAAVTGELTREWRETNKPNETGNDVVAHATSLKTRFGTQSTRRRNVQDDANTDMANMPELPEGWVWTTLSDFSHASSYGTSVRCSQDAQGVAVLRIPNVRAGRIDLTNLKWATADLHISGDELLAPGDLLVVRTNGSEDLIGRAAIVDEPLKDPAYFASYLIRFRIVNSSAIRRWIGTFFETPVARTWIQKNIASSAGQYNISQSALMRMPVPVPPQPEIAAILTTLKEMESIQTDAAADASIAAETTPALRQSTLKAAFEGKLVEQDPRDEPADVLLARLNERQPDVALSRRARRARGTTAGAEA